MPLNPSVFRPIRENDVHQRPFKAYKNYRIESPGISSGYVTESANFAKYRYDGLFRKISIKRVDLAKRKDYYYNSSDHAV